MENPTCKDCEYFYQHYTLNAYRCTPVNCGSCHYPRLKHRKPDKPACDHFMKRERELSLPNRAAVMDFLTVDVLERILKLKIPPEIEE